MLWKTLLVQFVQLLSLGSCYEGISKNLLDQLVSIDNKRLMLNGSDTNSHLTHFNTTRRPSSKESIAIQQYIEGHFELLNENSSIKWDIELDRFEEKGLNFTNVILTKSPPSTSSYLLLAAHYDTLVHMDNFIGAIDSAVSCGILLDIAESLNPFLDQGFADEDFGLDVGLKIVFFDGEEALERWSSTDSIYGARHLHNKWQQDGTLEDIELFVLLDLLGAHKRVHNYVPSYFPQTHSHYADLSSLETRLIQLLPGMSLKEKYLAETDGTFRSEYRGIIEDDHLPFLRSNIPVLHLIPVSFPKQWHTVEDDLDHVDPVAIDRWNILLRAFVAQYLEL